MLVCRLTIKNRSKHIIVYSCIKRIVNINMERNFYFSAGKVFEHKYKDKTHYKD